MHEGGELRGRSVGEDATLGDDDDAVADLFDDFEDVGDVEDGFALGGEQFKKVFEEAGGDDIEAGEWFIKDEQLGIVKQGGGDEDALTHSLGVGRDGRVLPGFEIQEAQKAGGFGLDEGFAQAAETADELEIFEAGEIGVEVRLFGDIAENAAEGDHVAMDVMALEEHAAIVGAEHAGDDFDGGGFAGAVGTEEADDFAGGEGEADVFNGGNAAITAIEMLELKHDGGLGVPAYPM